MYVIKFGQSGPVPALFVTRRKPIMADTDKEKVTALIAGAVRGEGYEIADVLLARFRNRSTLRVLVYSKSGVTIDGCARLSRLIGDIIDGTDLFAAGYTLEVSSPGLDRPLRTAKDFEYRVGENVEIRFTDESRKQETAEVVAASEDRVEFRNASGVFALDLAEIKEARIII